MKIYLEPKKQFDKAIHDEQDDSIVYDYQKILEVLVENFKAPEEPESYEIADEYFWYNIERLKDYYSISFYYEDYEE